MTLSDHTRYRFETFEQFENRLGVTTEEKLACLDERDKEHILKTENNYRASKSQPEIEDVSEADVDLIDECLEARYGSMGAVTDILDRREGDYINYNDGSLHTVIEL